jgi:hypothetical protein
MNFEFEFTEWFQVGELGYGKYLYAKTDGVIIATVPCIVSLKDVANPDWKKVEKSIHENALLSMQDLLEERFGGPNCLPTT